jgi:hypothetical protein
MDCTDEEGRLDLCLWPFSRCFLCLRVLDEPLLCETLGTERVRFIFGQLFRESAERGLPLLELALTRADAAFAAAVWTVTSLRVSR